jgi:ATP-dependent DNA helicase RecQ
MTTSTTDGTTGIPDRTEIEVVGRERFGWDDLHTGQLEAVEAVLSGRDVLGVMPTGYGKSAIYQLSTVLLDGLTLVISPLIALQEDQVAGLADAPDAPPAVALNSSRTAGELEEAWRVLEGSGPRIAFLAPEQLAKDELTERLRGIGVSLFVVDEAHCVSSWGHDFRPDYLRLGPALDRLGHPAVIALTATGSSPVRREIAERLGLRDPLVLTRGFDRPNILLEVERHESETEKHAAVLDQVAELPRPGLLYVATRKASELFAEELADRGIRTAAYHGGLSAKIRAEVHEAFLDDGVDVVVATSAFGMGIDKPNVRFVVHAAVPESVDEYYQEVGRAGRDGEPATAALHYRPEDLALRKFFAARTPDRGRLRAVYRAVEAAGRPVPPAEIGRELDLATRSITGSVNLLADAGVLATARKGVRVVDAVGADEAAERAVQAAEEGERIERSRLEMMRAYAETRDCRRAFLLGYFGEERLTDCGHCDICLARKEEAATSGEAPAPPPVDFEETPGAESTVLESAGDDAYPLQAAVTHREWGPGVVMRHEDDRITVFFEQEGYKVLSRKLIEENDLLTVD